MADSGHDPAGPDGGVATAQTVLGPEILSTTTSDSSGVAESARADAVPLGPDGPAGSPAGIATTGATSASGTDPGAPVMHPTPRRPDSDGDAEAGGGSAPAAVAGATIGDVAPAKPGCWLPLREAVREVGSLEHLYRLARDGKLPSRDDADGRIEVWVTDADRSDAALARSLEDRLVMDGALPARLEAPGPGEPSAAGEQITSAISERIGRLLAPLVEGYERYVELARENGALSERVADLEQELHVLRGVTMSDGQALERLESRLRALEGVNLAMAQLFAAPLPFKEPRPD